MSVVKKESVTLSWNEVERIVIASVRASGVPLGEGVEMVTDRAGVQLRWSRVEEVSIPQLEAAAATVVPRLASPGEIEEELVDAERVDERPRRSGLLAWLAGDRD